MLRNMLLAAAVFSFPAWAGQPLGLGRTPTEAEVAAWNIDILPDGTGLPPGQGSVAQGGEIFVAMCAACHGAHGEAGDNNPVPRLAGGQGTLITPHSLRTVGSYWPFATTLFDYIRRAMPLNAPQTLTDDQVYAVAAYVLSLNGVVPQDTVLNRTNLAAIKMPNRDGFVRAGAGQGNAAVPR
ncbi:MAG: cytochrome c [Acetobacteraceae bacterium]